MCSQRCGDRILYIVLNRAMKFIPKPHQEAMLETLRNSKRVAQFAFMGSGKTVTTLSFLVEANEFPVLVIAPLRVAKTTWINEVSKWDHLKHLKVSFIGGNVDTRTRALQADADIYTINYENIPWLVETLGKDWKFKVVVADESTRLKGFRSRQGSKRAKALAKVAHTLVKRMILLTGTPAPNGLLDLWGQMWFIDKGERLGKSYSAYLERWFNSDYMGYTWTPKRGAQDEIQKALSDVCYTVKVEDWFTLDEPIVTNVKVSMPEKCVALYKKMEKEMFLELENENFEAIGAASKSMKCRQMASGVLYGEEGWKVLHDEKLSALESIIEESGGMPIMVAYHFKSDLERLQNHFPKGRVLDANPTTEKEWNEGKIPLLFLHPASAGMGLNLQDGGNILVFFTCDWQMENHVQVIERIGAMRQKQSGYDRPVFLYYITAEGTIDELVIERLSSKKSVQEILLNAMKRRG